MSAEAMSSLVNFMRCVGAGGHDYSLGQNTVCHRCGAEKGGPSIMSLIEERRRNVLAALDAADRLAAAVDTSIVIHRSMDHHTDCDHRDCDMECDDGDDCTKHSCDCCLDIAHSGAAALSEYRDIRKKTL
jgi:hypothetical protein